MAAGRAMNDPAHQLLTPPGTTSKAWVRPR
ncbi:hypothetical protein [Streptomyces mirabilis]